MKAGPEIAESIGTFCLVFVGCGAIMTNTLTGTISHLGIAAAFGLIIGAMVYATGHLSGAHFNPAVTIAFAATGHFPWRRVPSYLLAQALGATMAAFLLRTLLGDVASMGTTAPSELVSTTGFLVAEVIITAILMFVIASVATDGRAVGNLAGSAIGSTVALLALVAGPWTGASMNPARSLGPALASGELGWLPHYVLAPLFGALAGAFLYEAIRKGDRPRKVSVTP